jgi:hypothetical protein
MKSFIRFAVALLATVIVSLGGLVDETHQNLDKLVNEAIRLIEGKEYVKLMETIVSPDDLKGITSNSTIEKEAERFRRNKVASLLAVLKSLKDKTPKVSPDGNTASFDISEFPDAPDKVISFEKVQGRWFIKN